MIGMTLENAIHKIIRENPAATFLVNGNTIQGDIRSYSCPKTASFIFVQDYMAVGTAAPNILSQEFIALRAEALTYPFDKILTVTTEKYEDEFASSLRELAEIKNANIVLLQYDCYVSQIWQLTMQAYIEQLGIATSVKRVCFCETDDYNFAASNYAEISIQGSHNAYCQLVCHHEAIVLARYSIEQAAVECYLDINSTTGALRNYICETSSKYDNPNSACGIFFRDFPQWGLWDIDYFKIAVETLSQNPKYAETVKKWKRILKRR